ncbi:MAG: DUF2631 domain-containing protein [Frankiaceae bacterium]|jgi:hypothetical protein|nr:DUF2631 domain-containing protein [Frankiaceae bacterium]
MSTEPSTSASPAAAHSGGYGEGAHAAHSAPASAGHGEVAHASVPHEQPSDWGWNGEWGKWATRGGWITVVILLLMFPGVTHYNMGGFIAQGVAIVGLIVILLWDSVHKRASWRK